MGANRIIAFKDSEKTYYPLIIFIVIQLGLNLNASVYFNRKKYE